MSRGKVRELDEAGLKRFEARWAHLDRGDLTSEQAAACEQHAERVRSGTTQMRSTEELREAKRKRRARVG